MDHACEGNIEEEEFENPEAYDILLGRITEANRQSTVEIPQVSESLSKECYEKAYSKAEKYTGRKYCCFCCGHEIILGVTCIIKRLEDYEFLGRLKPRSENIILPNALDPLLNDKVYATQGILDNGECSVCTSCDEELQKDGKHPPRFSLANGLYTGPSVTDQPYNLPPLNWIEKKVPKMLMFR